MLTLTAAACGESIVTPPPPPLPQPNFIRLVSDPGDGIGGGASFRYTQADAIIELAANAGHLTVTITGDDRWRGEFQVPNTHDRFVPGEYAGLERYAFHNPAKGGLEWTGRHFACNTILGSFSVDSVRYSDANLTAIDLRFEQHCEGAGPALRGTIHWRNDDATKPAGPVTPVPAGLWKPAAGTTPSSGNYFFLASDQGDHVGGGRAYTYTQANAVITVDESQLRIEVEVQGDQQWKGFFAAMSSLTRFETGYYSNLQRYPFHNPAKGGLDWSGEGRGCNDLSGWVAVDQVTYTGTILTAIDLRFEQRCGGAAPPLHGAIHWRSDDATKPPPPINPIPASLWSPAPGSSPSGGNYVYLESEPNEWIGGGNTYTYGLATFGGAIQDDAGHLRINVGTFTWRGDFQTMNTLSQFEPGYYPDLRRYPFHNPAKGGLAWSGMGRGCNGNGWFVVDQVSYSGGRMTSLQLRFEQRCDGAVPALHGVIRFTR